MTTHRQNSPLERRAKLTMNILCLDVGASAIEFALIIPFLLMLAGGIVEMANVFFVRSQLNEIVRDATRRLAVDSLSPDEARKFIAERLAETTDAKGDIDVSETAEKEEDEVDVTVSLGVPLKDVLIFDFVADSLVGSDEKAPELSVTVTMFKH